MASKRNLRRRMCDSKKSYETEAEAKNALWYIRNRLKDFSMWQYKCQFCSKWHLGHPCGKLKQRIQTARKKL